jgi:hypothetical protein
MRRLAKEEHWGKEEKKGNFGSKMIATGDAQRMKSKRTPHNEERRELKIRNSFNGVKVPKRDPATPPLRMNTSASRRTSGKVPARRYTNGGMQRTRTRREDPDWDKEWLG